MRKLFYWKLKDREIKLGERTIILGVLNVTPDSFSDGGKYADPDRAFAHALEMEEQGADIIDVGAESTRPGSARISAAEELRRLIPVLKRLRGHLARARFPWTPTRPRWPSARFDHGAEIINDPTGLTFEPHLARVVSNHDAGLILNHMRGRPESWAKLPPMPDVMGAIVRDLEATVSRARHTGIDRSKIVIDPGIGFGKRKEQNAEILARLRELARLELPILVGPSRKSFLAHATEDRDGLRHRGRGHRRRCWPAPTWCASTTCARCAPRRTWRTRLPPGTRRKAPIPSARAGRCSWAALPPGSFRRSSSSRRLSAPPQTAPSTPPRPCPPAPSSFRRATSRPGAAK